MPVPGPLAEQPGRRLALRTGATWPAASEQAAGRRFQRMLDAGLGRHGSNNLA
ncbi:MAG TPA: hypothetical protein VIZ00_05275 [Streptosporangiaceae bacterium]